MSSDFPQGTRTSFARAVAAEIRAQLAARQLTYKELVLGAGLSSTNYVSIRLRDVKPFDLDDIDKIAAFFSDGSAGSETSDFIRHAVERHEERIWDKWYLSRTDRSEASGAGVEADGRGDSPAVLGGDELTEAELDDEEGLLYDDSLDQPQAQPLRRGMPGGAAPLADAARTTNREPGLTKRRREHDEAAERIEQDPTGMEPL